MRAYMPVKGLLAGSLLVAGISLVLYSQAQLQVGYTRLTADTGTRIPVAAALFTYTNAAGVLVSQAGVGAAEPILSGRIFVDESGTQTGIALVNPSLSNASVTLILRDTAGKEVDRKTESLSAGQHLPRYVTQLFSGLAAGFRGSLSFSSNQKIAAITLRESRNAQGEPLYTTLPVVDLALPASTERLVFPHIAAGEGYDTQLILINTTTDTLRGQIRLTASDGNPLSLRLNGIVSSQFSYQIEPNGAYRAELDSPSGLGAGYAVIVPDAGTLSPSGAAIFQFKRTGIIVTEAGVSASPSTTSARIFVDSVRTYTGVAIANSSNQSTIVSFTLLDRYGTFESTTTRTVAPQGHLAIFAHQLFPELPNSFTGLMEISSSIPVSPITLKLTDNTRGDQVLTTLPVADLTRLSTATTMVFPQIAVGEGFSTRLILINTDKTKLATGRMNFYQSDGSPMTVPLGSKTDSQFSYEVSSGGGKQFLPGNTAKIAGISLLDPSSGLLTKEVVVNEGNSLRAKLLVLDTTGLVRDDFDVTYSSLSTDIASIDNSGNIQGKKAGFSTLTISSGEVVATGTIVVVSVTSGIGGYEITGIAQDASRKLYLANSNEHTILLAQDLKQTPAVYAGVPKTAGIKNDLRLQSWFKSPAFLAFNQADGSLYVSDKANHVIRKVRPGPAGRVESFAGTGMIGSRDGTLKEATFNSPEGIALDNRGNLWVVDTGNHTIRRISLTKGTVETMAGSAGSSGWADGAKGNARFSSPAGIALETEPLAQQLDRASRGEPPPPVRLVVADTGNGVIRRINENGEVTTVRSLQGSNPAGGRTRSQPSAATAPLSFVRPAGIAVDPLGNIFVTEPGSNRVSTILSNGEVVPAAQPKTFNQPNGVVSAQSGKIVVAEKNSTGQEVNFASPEITSITTVQGNGRNGGTVSFTENGVTRIAISNKGGENVTIRGKNFAPETTIVAAGQVLSDAKVSNTQSISFKAPALLSGRTTLTVQNRGGVAQTSLLVEPTPVKELAASHVTTVAGGSTYAGEGGSATAASINEPYAVALDSEGSLYISEQINCIIRKIDLRTGVITTVAGSGIAGYEGDNDTASAAQLSGPLGIALDAADNLFIADTGNSCVRKVDARSGIITTVAGDGTSAYSGDGGPASQARLTYARSVAFDSSGNLLIVDGNHRIRRVDAQSGIITTIAGNGTPGFSGDGGSARSAQLNIPYAVAADSAGNVFIADSGNYRIRKVDANTGIITTFAGTGLPGFSGDAGPATSAKISLVFAISIDAGGNLFITDPFNGRVRKIDRQTGVMTTAAIITGTVNLMPTPRGIAVDAAGNLLIADNGNNRIRRLNTETGVMATIAGDGTAGFLGDNEPAFAAQLNAPTGIATGSGLFIADTLNHRIRKVDGQTGIIKTVAGTGLAGGGGNNGLATSAQLRSPAAVAVTNSGDLFVADTWSYSVRKVDAKSGIITAFAGTGVFGFSGDGGLASETRLSYPYALAVDGSGNLLIADRDNLRIRRVDASTRIITTIAGNGSIGFGGDGFPATSAPLGPVSAIAVDSLDNVFIADTAYKRVRRIDAKSGIITTVAGSSAIGGFSGDGGPAIAARLNSPRGIAMDRSGNLLIADTQNYRIRKVDLRSGIITTVAGTGKRGFTGDNGPGTAAELSWPVGVAEDETGNLLIVDDRRVRVVRGQTP